MVGLSEEVFGRTVEYLKSRKQFGKLIGEFQALQQLEFLFNLTLNTDAKNLALEKLKAHKKSSSAESEVRMEHEPVQMMGAAEDLALG